ncbi:cilia- and flagella-associated protein 107 [Gouania willdenowi]|uniref:cilia- and flagella-associated protein 107 n=1 Tax=Gouania willdenowi TaxID=441366 RepID=UPI0010546A3D|nr:uncharacterized protein C1orf158 homolog [Gouania willdenowi]
MNRMDLVKDKWAQSGWKIEQKYGNKVLLGNWAEDRLQFTRELKIADSSSRRDFQPHWDFRPDVSARRSSLMRAEGHPFKTLFGQSGQPSAHYLVTEYRESYGKKSSEDLPTLHPVSLTGQLGRPISGKTRRTYRPIPSNTPTAVPEISFPKAQVPSPPLDYAPYRSAYPRHSLNAFCKSCFARSSHRLSNYDSEELDQRQHSH